MRWTKAPHQIEDVYNLEDALLVGSLFMTMFNHADRVKISCLAQLVNVIAPIMTSDKGAWRQTIFYPFMYCSRYGKGTALQSCVECEKYDSKHYSDVPYIFSSVIFDDDNGRLAVFIMNRDLEEDCILESDLRQFENYAVERHIAVGGDDIKAVNSEQITDAVRGKDRPAGSTLDESILRSVIEKHSFNVILLKRQNKTI